MAIACLRERTFPLPRFNARISSRTKALAWVVGFFPRRFAVRARVFAFFVGMSFGLRFPVDEDGAVCR
jgi:hypothetical protein